MKWYEIVLGVVLIAVSVLIVVFTLAQEQKGQLPPAHHRFRYGRHRRAVDAQRHLCARLCDL